VEGETMTKAAPVVVVALACAWLANCAEGHTEAQVAAAQSVTFEGIGFQSKATRSRKTFTDKFPESADDPATIDDRGKKTYEAKLSGSRRMQARYQDGILYELAITRPRLHSSYKKLIGEFGPPDAAAPRGTAFVWKLGNMKITLKVSKRTEVVTYYDTKYQQAVAEMSDVKGK
jgi:hypothetical protein